MNLGADRMDVFLQPGEYYFGEADTCIRTLLGSCVSFTAWHPRHRIGAMSHFLLPTRRARRGTPFDGRYCDEAVLWLMAEASAHGTHLSEYDFKVFGGGDMFATGKAVESTRQPIGEQNVARLLMRLDQLGQPVVSRHIGGTGHRNLVFDIATGDVWVRHVPTAVEPARKAA